VRNLDWPWPSRLDALAVFFHLAESQVKSSAPAFLLVFFGVLIFSGHQRFSAIYRMRRGLRVLLHYYSTCRESNLSSWRVGKQVSGWTPGFFAGRFFLAARVDAAGFATLTTAA
jgi:hypothetical protein